MMGKEAAPAAAAPAETPAAIPAASTDSSDLSSEEVHDLLNFDAFGDEPVEEPAAPDEAGADAPAAEGEATPEGEGEPLEPGTTDVTPPSDEEAAAAAVAAETAEKAVLLQRIAALEQRPPPAATPPAAPAAASSEPAFAFAIPDELMNLLGSEDLGERKQAVSALSQGIAKETYRAAMSQVTEAFKQMPRIVQAALEQQNSSRSVFEDFYGAHTDLNRPELRPVIMETAKSVMAAEAARLGVQVSQMPWSADLRDKVAARAREVLGIKAASAGKGKGGGPKPLPKGGGAAPRAKIGEGESSKLNSPADIAATLFGT